MESWFLPACVQVSVVCVYAEIYRQFLHSDLGLEIIKSAVNSGYFPNLNRN